jgi:type VI secretion system secreted protein VgrG
MEGNKLMDLQSVIGSQNRRLFKVVGLDASGDEELLLEHLSGTESLSKLFELELGLLSRRPDFKLKSF